MTEGDPFPGPTSIRSGQTRQFCGGALRDVPGAIEGHEKDRVVWILSPCQPRGRGARLARRAAGALTLEGLAGAPYFATKSRVIALGFFAGAPAGAGLDFINAADPYPWSEK